MLDTACQAGQCSAASPWVRRSGKDCVGALQALPEPQAAHQCPSSTPSSSSPRCRRNSPSPSRQRVFLLTQRARLLPTTLERTLRHPTAPFSIPQCSRGSPRVQRPPAQQTMTGIHFRAWQHGRRRQPCRQESPSQHRSSSSSVSRRCRSSSSSNVSSRRRSRPLGSSLPPQTWRRSRSWSSCQQRTPSAALGHSCIQSW